MQEDERRLSWRITRWGPGLLGYRHPRVPRAVRSQQVCEEDTGPPTGLDPEREGCVQCLPGPAEGRPEPTGASLHVMDCLAEAETPPAPAP